VFEMSGTNERGLEKLLMGGTPAMRLKTSAGEIHFNPQTISHVHLNADRTLLTVHFVEGTHSGFDAESDEDHLFFAEFLGRLTDESSGFVAIGNEVLNLKTALWISIPTDEPIQVRLGDSRTRIVDEKDRERITKLLAE
jgi:hypothetical protein